MDQDRLKKETKIVSVRSDYLNANNKPGISVILPAVDNSVYSEFDWGEPVLKGSWGKKIEYELWDSDKEAYFEKKDSKDLLNYKKAKVTAKIRYPAKLKVLTFTQTQTKHGDIEVEFNGPEIEIRGDERLELYHPERLEQYQAFDANGRRLKNVRKWSDSWIFWGEPKELRAIQVEEWIDIEIPFNLKPARKL